MSEKVCRCCKSKNLSIYSRSNNKSETMYICMCCCAVLKESELEEEGDYCTPRERFKSED